jgi:hypothetical protein
MKELIIALAVITLATFLSWATRNIHIAYSLGQQALTLGSILAWQISSYKNKLR